MQRFPCLTAFFIAGMSALLLVVPRAFADWQRSDPLSAIHLPTEDTRNDRCNQQVVGIVTKKGSYLVTWTMASEESKPDQCVGVYAPHTTSWGDDYTLSSDRGKTWTDPAPMRYSDDGEIIRNPNAPCPMIKLSDGRIVMLFYNAKQSNTFGPRNPIWITVGKEVLDAEQPVHFNPPSPFMEVNGKPPLGSTYMQIGTYSSLFEHDGKLLFFYNDSKHWVLFKHVPENLLSADPTDASGRQSP